MVNFSLPSICYPTKIDPYLMVSYLEGIGSHIEIWSSMMCGMVIPSQPGRLAPSRLEQRDKHETVRF